MSRAGESEIRFEVIVRADGNELVRLDSGANEGRDPADSLEELRALVERVSVLAEALGLSDRWLTARQGAVYLGLTYDQFRAYAPSMPRHNVGERSYRYYQPELREWLLER